MSGIFEERGAAREGPLSEREIAQLRRLLSDPFSIPPDFWAAVRSKMSDDPPDLYASSIIGFSNSAERTLPVKPVVDLGVDISAALTDLPGPGRNLNSIWLVNPGGGSLRSIGEPFLVEGARITLKGSALASTTLKHNDGSSGDPNARPLLLHGGADLVLTDTESIDLVYVDTFWQDVARVETPPSVGLTSRIIRRTTPLLLTDAVWSTAVWETEERDDFGQASMTTIGVPATGVYLANMNVMLSGGSGVGRALINLDLYNSGAVHQILIGGQTAPELNSQMSVAGLIVCNAGDYIVGSIFPSASGSAHSFAGRMGLARLL